ncbi:hypothetical protein DTO013E5_4889 [Penicillium roqueforti]|nr:hypothetical protein DTO012A1_3428 [Penicillium roqueforti]KAI2755373.1 hypothetical protein DTO013F2_1056 [Penicillium roqueforti]KAI3210604.1 hypothetical protein DTO013E5_4889 [Penicillium roqueforti]
MERNPTDDMESPLTPKGDSCPNSQPSQLVDTEASNAQTGTATALPDPSSWPHGDCWKSSRPTEPTSWAPNAKLCDCPQHPETTWPAEHAILFIPDCAKRCPYCSWKTEKTAKIGNPAPMLRRHIRQYHLKEGDKYPGISVDQIRPPRSMKREYTSYKLIQGGPPKLEKNTKQG